MLRDAERLQRTSRKIAVATVGGCGGNARGGLEAGRLLAEVCLGGLGEVRLQSAGPHGGNPLVCVRTDHPVAACMGSQYAGWKISSGKFFAMGSGPFRAAGSKEKLIDEIGCREQPEVAAGVLETRRTPPEEVCREIAAACGVEPEQLYLLMAPTASLAGSLQVVARTIETALNKMH